MFSDDPDVSEAGAALAGITLTDSVFVPALRALLTIETAEGVNGPVDFRSLGVREFGTIYEGLLESELAIANSDLSLGKGNTYVPSKSGKEVVVEAGEVYLHDRSGARKSSGSYYTKSFAVEHLLKGSLEPALEDHFQRLDGMDDSDASANFFDFRIADIAMGSGHFLITAIDHVERRMADYLARRNLSDVRRELANLRAAASQSLGELASATTIEDGQLLRRMIARHCVYGVDINSLAVQLSRVSVWIHTFVPGLPLSVLDHTLVHGNSLVGIGTIDEIQAKFDALSISHPLWVNPEKLLGAATSPLRRLANLNDATLSDIDAARVAILEVNESIQGTRDLCDVIVGATVSEDESVTDFPLENWEIMDSSRKAAIVAARRELKDLNPLHFVIAFPEVFLGENPGFNVIVGNPPWQEAAIEEHAFWARHFPGLRAKNQSDQEREKAQLRKDYPALVALYESELSETTRTRNALVAGNFPGMGTGDADLYKAFCWRFWELTSKCGGRIGIVLPRSAFIAKGSTEFRKSVFQDSESVDLTMLLNNRGWVFPEVHQQYSIALTNITRGTSSNHFTEICGPFASYDSYLRGVGHKSKFNSDEVLAWNDSASLPLLPSNDSLEVFAQLRKSPRLDLNVKTKWRARPDRELDATNDKPLMDLVSIERPRGYWPVYKGSSFDLWEPDKEAYYACADPKLVQARLQQKRLRAGKGNRNSPHQEFTTRHLKNKKTLPCFSPRIAFRNTTNPAISHIQVDGQSIGVPGVF